MSTAANSPVHMLKLNSRREVAKRTLAFEFEKPAAFVFKAGQFAEITWLDPAETDAESEVRLPRQGRTRCQRAAFPPN